MRRIAVIGAGIFGCEISVALAKSGYDVPLFEKKDEILNGSTTNSVRRLHLGFHYPRSVETAVQSRLGFRKFMERYPESVDSNFPNYYAIAKEDSKTTTTEFKAFASAAQIEMSQVPIRELNDIGIDLDKIDSVFEAKEGVISVERTRDALHHELSGLKVRMIFATEVSTASLDLGIWTLQNGLGNQLGEFDYVVRATYGLDSIQLNNVIRPRRNYEHHRTLTLQVTSMMPRIGMTVIDGDFLTVLPVAFEESHLIYGPSPSVIEKWTGERDSHSLPTGWGEEVLVAQEKLIARLINWFPDARPINIQAQLLGLRTIEHSVEKTDERISQFEVRAPNFIDVLSGKIDHCVDIASGIEREIGKAF